MNESRKTLAPTKVLAASGKEKGLQWRHTTSVPLPGAHVTEASPLGDALGKVSSVLTVSGVPERSVAGPTSSAHFAPLLQASSPELEVRDLMDGLPSMSSDYDGMDVDAAQSSTATAKRKAPLSPGESEKLMRASVLLLLIELPCC
jgi:hypothetical protein